MSTSSMLNAESGAIYVMDRGYVDFGRLHTTHRAGAFFVMGAKTNMKAHQLYSAPVDRTTGVICDQTIALDGHYACKDYPERLANHFELPALTIAALYKNRWQVELFSSG